MNETAKVISFTQDLRERNVKVMLMAMIIAVATVATINAFADHLQKTLMTSASAFLAADRQLNSRTNAPIPEAWYAEAEKQGLQVGRMIEFGTMVSNESQFQLVAVKAIDNAYPLRGEIEWQTDLDSPRQVASNGPQPGEVWLNPRLMRLLELRPGDALEIGATSLEVTGVIMREPDGGFRLSALAPRLMMHVDDVAATEVIQPGSRVRHRGLFAGSEAELAGFEAWLEPRLTDNYSWVDVRQGETLGESLEKAEGFLLLGGSLAVLLAVVAIGVASRQYALSQRDRVALLKTMGLTGKRIRKLYLSRLVVWGLMATVIGLLLAIPSAWLLASLTAQLMDQPLQFGVDFWQLWPAVLTALAALFAFAYPPIDRLRNTPAMRVFRSLPTNDKAALVKDLLLAVLVIFGLLWVYVNDIKLVTALLGAVVALVISLAVAGAGLIWLLRRFPAGKGGWRLAVIALYRHRNATLSQMSVFAMTIMLAATLVLVRSSLLADWQAQLPEDAPNHFLLNIAPESVDEVETFFSQHQINRSPLYPIVRGRLTEINAQPAQEVALNKDDDELRRELNLTTSDSYPDDNQIVAGQWFKPGETSGLSIEQSLADSLGVEVGDELGFTVGAEKVSTTITSIRSVQWDSMRPNFFIIFPPDGTIDGLPSTSLTSFYLAEQDKALLNDFVRQFPTISVLEIDHIIERIQQIIAQVTQAVEAILLMILLAAIAVMVAVVSATMSERQREGALLRTLGGQQKLLVRSTTIEFALIGFLAGILGVLAAETAVWALQNRMFEGEFRWHWPVVISLPFISAVILAILGRWQLTPVLTVSPMLLLRRLE
ncbi:ABC transporter permease [Methylophaga sp. UBA2689]|uniref:ABC transporter permease n=1 Tax=Methylophaga sp. UBA2689 TaxID=1946878 RepID=UPI0025EF9B75|nr:FtsX-like permease family protein [Methylophaga sp. UBA2689]|tara:strand:+ start:10307 stop:12790 length:2484 start_codon:yes stop_codon:yes gene_type:complete